MKPGSKKSTRFRFTPKLFGSVISMISILLVMGAFMPERLAAQEKSVPDSIKAKPGKTKYKVTFIELGSVRCIPCQKMQPVMKSIEEKYGNEVKVVFYDVWTKEGKPYADKYKVNAIPTQIFLDSKGKEFFRHEGFFAEEELVKVLKSKKP